MINDKSAVQDVHKLFNLSDIVFKYLTQENVLLFVFILLDTAILNEMKEDLNSPEGQQEYRDYFVYVLNKFSAVLNEKEINIDLLINKFL